MKYNLIISHANCPDGMGAAWAVRKRLGDSAEYHFCSYDDKKLPDVRGKDVVFVDVCFSLPVMQDIVKKANSVLILDHHKTSMEAIQGKLDCDMVFDMTRSGARLAWDFFHPGEPVPDLIKYIEDRDLWVWKYPESKEYLAFADTFPRSFEGLEKMNQVSVEEAVAAGKAIRSYVSMLVDHSVSRAQKCILHTPTGPVKVWALNSSVLEIVSEVGNEMAALSTDRDVAVVWFYEPKKGAFRFSLRGKTTDVSAIASLFPNGGGHKGAAGFSWPGSDITAILTKQMT